MESRCQGGLTFTLVTGFVGISDLPAYERQSSDNRLTCCLRLNSPESRCHIRLWHHGGIVSLIRPAPTCQRQCRLQLGTPKSVSNGSGVIWSGGSIERPCGCRC